MPLLRRLGLLLALGLFAALALPNLMLPGLHHDEAQEAGLQAQQILAAAPITAFRGAAVAFAGREWPLMVQDYIGALNVFLALPFFALFGANVVALRLMAVSIGLSTIALTYAFASEAFGRRPAAIAALLLAVQPSFLFWSRQGVFVTSITAALAMGALWAGTAWAQRGRRAWQLALAGLCAGLGIYAKLLFVWLIGGAVGAGIILALAASLERQALRVSEAKLSHAPDRSMIGPLTHYALLFSAAFALGLSPLLLYNIKAGGTLASIRGNFTTSYYGVNNLDLAHNLAARWDQLRAVLAGRDHLWYLGGSFGNPATEWFLGLAVGVIVIRALARRPASRAPLALVLATLFAFLQSIFTVSGLFPTHFAVFMPFFPLIIALGIEGLIFDVTTKTQRHEDAKENDNRSGLVPSWLSGFQISSKALLLLALGGSLARDVWVDVSYHRVLARTGGLNAHSDAVYALAAYLDEQPDRSPVVALDWGFAPAVRFLTAGRVAPDEVFGYTWETDAGFEARLSAAFDDPNSVFILHWPQETIFPRREAFEAALVARGLRTVTVQTFSRRDGAPIFDVMKVEE